MIDLPPPFRLAGPDDGPVLARLVNDAGEGLPLHLWTRMAGPGEHPWAIGARRQAAKAAEGQVVVIDEGAGAIAGLTGYAIGPAPEPLDGVEPLFRPLVELENEAPDSWYVNVLAALPEVRRRGHGARLLKLAERIAASEGLGRMSLIVADDNTGARRFYARAGYVQVGARPMAKNGWRCDGENWLLMMKTIGREGMQ